MSCGSDEGESSNEDEGEGSGSDDGDEQARNWMAINTQRLRIKEREGKVRKCRG